MLQVPSQTDANSTFLVPFPNSKEKVTGSAWVRGSPVAGQPKPGHRITSISKAARNPLLWRGWAAPGAERQGRPLNLSTGVYYIVHASIYQFLKFKILLYKLHVLGCCRLITLIVLLFHSSIYLCLLVVPFWPDLTLATCLALANRTDGLTKTLAYFCFFSQTLILVLRAGGWRSLRAIRLLEVERPGSTEPSHPSWGHPRPAGHHSG